MNRIDRLFAITTRLLGGRIVRAADLADTFEVSRRTIYRDVAALSESGVPVVSLPGQGYTIAEGYTLPPLLLSADEATALVLGARLLMAEAGPTLAEAAAHAVAKIVSVLPDATRRSLQDVDRTVDIPSMPSGAPPLDLTDARIASLRQAIIERWPVLLRYVSRSRGEESVRVVEPDRLSYVDGAWYLSGYCRLRAGERAFRLDRIDELAVLDRPFPPRAPAPQTAEAVAVEARIRFRGPAARWARERQHWTFVAEETNDDGTVFTYAVETLDDLVRWLLGWGSDAEVLSPAELRERVRAEAQTVVEMLT